VDRAAITSLAEAARALDPGASTRYDAGSKQDRRARQRIRLCEAAAEVLDKLAQRLQAALDRLQQVPFDLGEVYELVYQFIRKGGKLPVYARWIEGAEPDGDRERGSLDHPAGRGQRRGDRGAGRPVGELAARAEMGLYAIPSSGSS
jgi:hypothetical protein